MFRARSVSVETMRTLVAIAIFSVVGSGLVVACGSDALDSGFHDPAGEVDGSIDPNGNGSSSGSLGDGAVDPDAALLALAPLDPVVTFTTGMPAPTVKFTATSAGSGGSVPATFSIDRGELGSIDLSTGLFTASGNVGGKAKITATWNGRTATTSVTVKIKASDNGLVGVDAGGGGAGGNGGVGGEGYGGAVDPATKAVLAGTRVADPGLTFLYPYDKTVWPRGVLAPLLQWRAGAQGDYDAVSIKLTENAYEYEGTFARTATPFAHHPIPPTAWKQLLASNAGEDVTVTIVLSKGGVAYGPLTETWKIASAPLKGVVYYNSYGTKLAKNFAGAIGGDGKFGAATLAIKAGSSDPTLVAGAGTGTDGTNCRVCHSVAANGSVLITQRNLGDLKRFSAYDLKTGAETIIPTEGAAAAFAWPAIYPDGSMFLGDSSSAAGSSTAPNTLYTSPTAAAPAPVAITTNWPAGFRAAYPSFSPDGKKLAFTLFGGIAGADTRSLGTMTFDNTTKQWGAVTAVHVPTDGNTDVFPSFLPTNDALVFEHETRFNGRDYGGTRSDADVAPPDVRADRGTRAQLWYLDLKSSPPKAVAMNNLNGAGYLPTGGNLHDDDATLNYEPTVNPVPSGGYAWVVFTSRRLYGNVATINPFHSDPRYNDLTSEPTPKKLWVAAIDLNAPAGTDPSHPAFYLPAQELLAGNSRGYWVVDPCHGDGTSCETGDECCGGFCRPGTGGALVCSSTVPTCAQEFEKCTVSADCCNSSVVSCINGRCATPGPK
ncbi:MAG: hypothetical protein JWP97_5298 [Labilithrix sp.]|nr:hypothetical protein [Labilithrix sp.]